MVQDRYLMNYLVQDLQKKMVFLAGARQVGKTTLAKMILEESQSGSYYNWDKREDRKNLLNAKWPSDAELIVIDELHKYRFWKRWIKGEFDHHREQFRFLVTGSARMDIFRKGGDSLQGRYHHYRLHPFSLAELEHLEFKSEILKPLSFTQKTSDEKSDAKSYAKTFEDLFKFGGFPEPFFQRGERDVQRWHHERVDRLIREDIRDLENVRDLTSVEILCELLIARAAKQLSLNSIREELDVSHRAISHWVDILERFYFIFRISPFTGNLTRSLKKESKVYLWDYSVLEDPAAKFENLIACHLLKFCHFLADVHGHKANLYYLRDLDKREVDFMVTIAQKPWFAVEVKVADEKPSSHLSYFKRHMNIPFLYQVVLKTDQDFTKNDVRVMPAPKFLSALI